MREYSLFLIVSTLGLIGISSLNVVYGQEEKDNSIFDIIQVTDSIYMLAEGGGNVGVFVGDDGIFLIDDKIDVLSEKLLNSINKISDKPVKFIINTHWHPDHVGGNEELAKTDSIIISHGNTRERLSNEQFSSFLNKTVAPLPESALPIITFNNEITFYFNNDVINVKHIPAAHTDGDAIVHFNNSNVIHVGDIVSDTYFPYVDISAGGSIDGLIEGIENMILPLANEETKIIVGHGSLSTKDHIIASLDMLKDIRSTISEAILQNKTLEEVHVIEPTEQHEEQYGDGFINSTQFTELVYKSLTSQQ